MSAKEKGLHQTRTIPLFWNQYQYLRRAQSQYQYQYQYWPIPQYLNTNTNTCCWFHYIAFTELLKLHQIWKKKLNYSFFAKLDTCKWHLGQIFKPWTECWSDNTGQMRKFNTNTNTNTRKIWSSIPIPIPGKSGFPIPIPILAKTPIPQYQYQVLSVSGLHAFSRACMRWAKSMRGPGLLETFKKQ